MEAVRDQLISTVSNPQSCTSLTPRVYDKKSFGKKSSATFAKFLKEFLDPSARSAEKFLDLLKAFLLGEVLEILRNSPKFKK